MTKTETTLVTLVGVALAAAVLFSVRNSSAQTFNPSRPDLGNFDVGLSQSPDDANTIGPGYLTSSMPYGFAYGGFAPAAPRTTAGMQGASSNDDCGCN